MTAYFNPYRYGQQVAAAALASDYTAHGVVYDITGGTNLLEKAPNTVVHIASLVKMMGALVIMDWKSGVLDSESVTFVNATDDAPGFTEIPLQDGDVLTWRHLLYGMALPSGSDAANLAARVIGEASLGGSPTASAARAEFVRLMNVKAAALGMTSSTFTEPTGGVEAGGNTSTANDVRKMHVALVNNATLRTIFSAASWTIVITGANARNIGVTHTVPLAGLTGVFACKSGANSNASNCAVLSYVTETGREISVVILKAGTWPSFGLQARYVDAKHAILQAIDHAPALLGGSKYTTSMSDPGSHRYWAIRVYKSGSTNTPSATAGGGYTALSEIIARTERNGPPVPISAVSTNMGTSLGSINNLNDFSADIPVSGGNTWRSQQHPEIISWIKLDLGAAGAAAIRELKLHNEGSNGDNTTLRDYDVLWADSDGVGLDGYTPAFSVRGAPNGGNATAARGYAPYAPLYNPGSHRYWRMNIKSGGNGVYYGICEIEMRESVGGADVTSTGFAIFVAQRTGFEATKAFDNIKGANNNNSWSTEVTPVPRWIGQNFGAGNNKRIVELLTTSRDDTFFQQMHQAFDLEYSDDGSSWTVAAKFIGVPAFARNENRAFTADYA